jgi:hypothetical protein
MALVMPRLGPDWGEQRQTSLLFFVVSVASALGFLFCVSALRDVGTATARRKRRKRQRRNK